MSLPEVIESPQRILYINVSRIGDTLLATPAIRAVAKAFPTARVTLLGHPKRAEVFGNLPYVAHTGRISKQRAKWLGYFGKKRFDLAFVCGFDIELVRYALRVAEKVVAFRQSDEKVNARLFRAVEHPPFQAEHAVDIQLRLPEAVGISSAGKRLDFALTAAERLMAKQVLSSISPEASPLVGLQVASFPTKAYRDWPIEHFSKVCNEVSKRWPAAHFLIFGGGEEKERTAWLAKQLGETASNFSGRFSLRETAALMSMTDIFVGVDTGPTHIMSTFDIPLVSMYHCLSSSKFTGPLDHPRAFVIDHPASGQANCSEQTSMADITVEQVFERIVEALNTYPPRLRPA